jgi:ethanolamine ammonia-lyase small subunit
MDEKKAAGKEDLIQEDPWQTLRQFTAARIALGRTGNAVPLSESLAFRLAHAHARDAVYSALATDVLLEALSGFGLPLYVLRSQASDRSTYLQRPDWGRRLHPDSAAELQLEQDQNYDLALIIADGLSATAVNTHVVALLKLLIPRLQDLGIKLAPLVLAEQGRVALADEIGELLHAKATLILIGERPGLSSPDSMGAYLTFAPAVGRTDESRNCLSNIRPEGLPFKLASEKLLYLIQAVFRLQLSGVALKDDMEAGLSAGDDAPASLI